MKTTLSIMVEVFHFHLVPLMAQVSVSNAVQKFLDFMALIFLTIGVLVLVFAGYLLNQGRVAEGLMSLLSAFIIALAIPTMKLFLQLAGVIIP